MVKSKQPHLKENLESFSRATYKWMAMEDIVIPPYTADSRKRDEYLRSFALRENHLASVINSVCSIDKNRKWLMTGGRNQVRRSVEIAHAWKVAPSLDGWRTGFGVASESFYLTDMGSVIELGRQGKNGPLRAMYHVDPAKCKLMQNNKTPLVYYPPKGKLQKWKMNDFMRVPSFPSTKEEFAGLGYCAVSRCIDLAMIMLAVYQHDKEQLGAQTPRGILTINGITQAQWETAMKARTEELGQKGNKYYAGITAIASMGPVPIDIKLTALSQIPKDFKRKEFTDLLMYAYALAFGYDPIEFWPTQYGGLGSGKEAEVQHQKATGKGGMDFVNQFQEQFQLELPASVEFEFTQRDSAGDLLDAEVALRVAKFVSEMTTKFLDDGKGILTRDQALEYLVNLGELPPEITAKIEDDKIADSDKSRMYYRRQELIEKSRIRLAIERFPDEPIIEYSFPADKEKIIWERGSDATKRKSFPAPKLRALYDGEDEEGTQITEEDVADAVNQAGRRVDVEYAETLMAQPISDEDLDELDEK